MPEALPAALTDIPEGQAPKFFLGIDIGNSAIKTTFFEMVRGSQSRIAAIPFTASNFPRLKWRDQCTRSDVHSWLQTILYPGGEQMLRGDVRAAICSVVPTLTKLFGDVLEQDFGISGLVLTSNLEMPVKNCYLHPEQVGMDRLAAAAGAVRRYGTPIVVVDAGTAVTVDAVNLRREFIGGAILPGYDLQFEALHRGTAGLKEVDVLRTAKPIGRTTEECIQAGVMYGIAGAVDRLVEEARRMLGKETPTVCCGGEALLLAHHARSIQHVVPQLVLDGTYEIFKMNQETK